MLWAGKMSQPVKCLSHKHEHLSADVEHSTLSHLRAHICSPRGGQADSKPLQLASQPGSPSELWVQLDPLSKTKVHEGV